MPAPKAKAAATTTTTVPKSKAPKSGTSGTSTPTTAEPQDATPAAFTGSGGRPDKAVYDAEQEKLKKDIDALNAKMVCSAHFADITVCSYIRKERRKRENIIDHQGWTWQ